MKKGKVIALCAAVFALVLSLSLPVFAIWNISVPFGSSLFEVIPLSYYLNSSGTKVPFTYSTGTWLTDPTTAMRFNVPGCTYLAPAYKYTQTTSEALWRAGEIITLSVTIKDLSASATFETDPSKYYICLTNNNYSINFYASSVTYSETGSSGYQDIVINFNATQSLMADMQVSGSAFQFFLPLSIPNTSTQYITIDFGYLKVTSIDGIENINTEKIVSAVEGAVTEDFGYETPSENEDASNKLQNLTDQMNSLTDGLNDNIDSITDTMENGIFEFTHVYSFLWVWFREYAWLCTICLGCAVCFMFRKILK